MRALSARCCCFCRFLRLKGSRCHLCLRGAWGFTFFFLVMLDVCERASTGLLFACTPVAFVRMGLNVFSVECRPRSVSRV